MKTLDDGQRERFSDLVEQFQALRADVRPGALDELRASGKEAAEVIELVALHFRLPQETAWVVGGEPLPGYRLIERLGEGGFGKVWKAEKSSGFRVAFKVVELCDPAVAALELRALDLLKGVRHPHLLSVIDARRLGSLLVLEMELADRSLNDRLREVRWVQSLWCP